MLCYRDMTFCTYYKDCVDAGECPRPLTPEVQAAADKWWESFKSEGGAPFSMFTNKPDCWVKK